jgi:succinate dehydrogenase / fumarate reductase cytochrome b subunit
MPPESDAMTVASKPEFRNISALSDLPTYRLPAAGWVSILHRVSGVLMFVLLPFILWLFDTSLSSEISFARFTSAFTRGLWIFPALLIKLVVLALIWAYLQHFFGGLRHLWMDVNHAAVGKEFGAKTAQAVLIATLLFTLALGAKLFGIY